MRRACLVLFTLAATLPAQKQPFTVEARLQLARISDPQVSPHGQTVCFTVQTIDVANNKRPKQIYLVPLVGGAARRITYAGETTTSTRAGPRTASASPSSPIVAAPPRSG
jgi:tricorn protease-like protein